MSGYPWGLIFLRDTLLVMLMLAVVSGALGMAGYIFLVGLFTVFGS